MDPVSSYQLALSLVFGGLMGLVGGLITIVMWESILSDTLTNDDSDE